MPIPSRFIELPLDLNALVLVTGVTYPGAGRLDALLDFDQLTLARSQGKAFGGFAEARVTFEPTYKYDKASRFKVKAGKRCLHRWGRSNYDFDGVPSPFVGSIVFRLWYCCALGDVSLEDGVPSFVGAVGSGYAVDDERFLFFSWCQLLYTTWYVFV